MTYAEPKRVFLVGDALQVQGAGQAIITAINGSTITVDTPLTFAAGVMRVNVWVFLVLVGIGKAARYALVLLAAKGIL